jgi:hypothetical protein
MRTSGTVEFTFQAAARVILSRDGLEWSAMAEGAASAPCAMTGLACDTNSNKIIFKFQIKRNSNKQTHTMVHLIQLLATGIYFAIIYMAVFSHDAGTAASASFATNVHTLPDVISPRLYFLASRTRPRHLALAVRHASIPLPHIHAAVAPLPPARADATIDALTL